MPNIKPLTWKLRNSKPRQSDPNSQGLAVWASRKRKQAKEEENKNLAKITNFGWWENILSMFDKYFSILAKIQFAASAFVLPTINPFCWHLAALFSCANETLPSASTNFSVGFDIIPSVFQFKQFDKKKTSISFIPLALPISKWIPYGCSNLQNDQIKFCSNSYFLRART